MNGGVQRRSQFAHLKAAVKNWRRVSSPHPTRLGPPRVVTGSRRSVTGGLELWQFQHHAQRRDHRLDLQSIQSCLFVLSMPNVQSYDVPGLAAPGRTTLLSWTRKA
jgi:hypothetical protein